MNIFRNLKEEFVPSAKVTWDIDTSGRRAGVKKIQRLILSPIIPCIHVKLSESPRSSKRFAFKTELLLDSLATLAFSKISLFLHHLRSLEKLVQSSSECGKGHLGEDYFVLVI